MFIFAVAGSVYCFLCFHLVSSSTFVDVADCLVGVLAFGCVGYGFVDVYCVLLYSFAAHSVCATGVAVVVVDLTARCNVPTPATNNVRSPPHSLPSMQAVGRPALCCAVARSWSGS